ncbi:MAG: hypothetical protein E6J13_05960 [Chloroflexi bacterium]|nr:MAG: hypothetical protein E6J13_05960 [Chloroflexota bacterium]
MQVAWLGEPASLDAATVGGKTANLGRLATSFRVPPGFCLDVSAFDELRPALEGNARARARLRELVAASYADLAQRVGEAEPRVAVRSSAIGEDAGDSSFAGQHETVLDVGGVDAIVDALLACWRSVASERAMAYRRERGIAASPRTAVLVQLMVPADASAIAFSADPVSGARDVVVVNAARGLGDAIASGEITPDIFNVRKSDLAIVERRVTDGGAMDDDAVLAIARLAVQLEKTMGWAVDLECAMKGGEAYLLQCRPITALPDEFPIVWSDPRHATLTWEREESHFDRLFGPLGIDFIRRGVDHGIRARGEELRSPHIVRHEAFNGHFYASVEPRDPSADMPAALTEFVNRRRQIARDLRRLWDEELLPELHAHYAWMRDLDLEGMTDAAAADTWLEVWSRMNRIWHIHFIITGSSYSVMEELAQAYETLVGGSGGEVLAVTQGRAPTLQRLEHDLGELTEAAAAVPPIRDALKSGTRSLEALAAMPGGARFARAAEAFLTQHGDIGQENFDIATAAWRDDPAKVLAIVAQRLTIQGADGDMRRAGARQRAEAIIERARALLAGRPDDLARFEEVLAAALGAGPLTEEHNYWIDRVSQAHARRLALAAGRRLVRERALGSPDEVFLLYVSEIADALRAPRPLTDLIGRRVSEVARWRRLRAPKTIGAPPSAPAPVAPGVALERVDFDYTVAQDGTALLKGVGASRQDARGRGARLPAIDRVLGAAVHDGRRSHHRDRRLALPRGRGRARVRHPRGGRGRRGARDAHRWRAARRGRHERDGAAALSGHVDGSRGREAPLAPRRRAQHEGRSAARARLHALRADVRHETPGRGARTAGRGENGGLQRAHLHQHEGAPAAGTARASPEGCGRAPPSACSPDAARLGRAVPARAERALRLDARPIARQTFRRGSRASMGWPLAAPSARVANPHARHRGGVHGDG